MLPDCLPDLYQLCSRKHSYKWNTSRQGTLTSDQQTPTFIPVQTVREDRYLWSWQNCCCVLLWKPQLIYYLSQKLPTFFPFTTSTRCNIGQPGPSMGTLSVSVVSMVLKDTPAGLVLGAKHLIGIDVKVALNLIITIKFGQALFNKKP